MRYRVRYLLLLHVNHELVMDLGGHKLARMQNPRQQYGALHTKQPRALVNLRN